MLHPGETFLIPWHPNVLRKFITWQEYLIDDVRTTANRLVREQVESQEELEKFLYEIDAINMIASFFVAVGFLVKDGLAVAAEALPRAAEEIEKESDKVMKEMAKWFVDTHAHLAADVTLLAGSPPSPPGMDLRFYLRHALGPWTPSYWASVYAAIKERDVGIYLYGSEWTTYKTAHQIADKAKLEVIKLQNSISGARAQLSFPFYRHRI